MAWTAPRTWATGEVLTDTLLNQQLRDNLLAYGDPGVWTTFSPSITAVSGGFQNGTTGYVNSGRYKLIGKAVVFAVKIRLGTGGGSGTGLYRLSLPVAASASAVTDAAIVGSTEYLDDSTATSYVGTARLVSSTSATLQSHGTAGVSATVPFTWTASDWLFCSGAYEAA